MLQRFTPAAELSILRAQQLATAQKCQAVEEAHLFLGVLDEEEREDGRITPLLALSGVTREEAELYARSAIETEGKGDDEEPRLTTNAKQILFLSREEARRSGSPLIGNEHIFIACVRYRRTFHLSKVLHSLGLDAARLRHHLRGLIQSEKPYREGNPLNHLTESSKQALDAAQATMRATFCGRISTAHLLLGVLEDKTNTAVEILHDVKVDIEGLKSEVRASIFSDGQIATPQKKFTPAAKRVLERAKKEAKECEHSQIGPQHLLSALLPRPVSIAEKVAFGHPIDDPLEGIWSHYPVIEVELRYEERWKQSMVLVFDAAPANLTETSKKAIAAAHTAMLNSSGSSITTAHLLLGILQNVDNDAIATLLAAGVDVERLKGSLIRSMVEGEQAPIAGKKFSAAVLRAFGRANFEAQECGHAFVGPHHLLKALLPRIVSREERLAFGYPLDDPLGKVWPLWPTGKIEESYSRLWLESGERLEKSSANPTSWIKVDGRWLLAGMLWWLWIPIQGYGPFLIGSGMALLLTIWGEAKQIYILRDRWGSFCAGLILGIVVFAAFFLLVSAVIR